MKCATSLTAILVLLMAGCNTSSTDPLLEQTFESEIPASVKAALEQGDAFELFSVDPRYVDKEQPKEFQFYRRKTIGKAIVSHTETRRRILEALEHGVRQVPPTPSCFDPRHAIRVKHEGKSIYLSICFQCNQVIGFVDGQKDSSLSFNTSNSPESVFDEVLREAGVPLADKDAVLDFDEYYEEL